MVESNYFFHFLHKYLGWWNLTLSFVRKCLETWKFTFNLPKCSVVCYSMFGYYCQLQQIKIFLCFFPVIVEDQRTHRSPHPQWPSFGGRNPYPQNYHAFPPFHVPFPPVSTKIGRFHFCAPSVFTWFHDNVLSSYTI